MVDLEDIDLEGLARTLRDRLGEVIEQDYLDGRTVLRDTVVGILECSALEAEELVDTMEARDYLRFPRSADATHSIARHGWIIVC